MLVKFAKNQKNPKKGGEKEMKLKGLIALSIIALLVMLPISAYAGYGLPGGPTGPTNPTNPVPGGPVTVTTEIFYTYDAKGKLTGQTQVVTSSGTDIDNWDYITVTTYNYEFQAGSLKLSIMDSTTTSTKTDGSKSVSTSSRTYAYDPTTGYLTGATGSRTTEVWGALVTQAGVTFNSSYSKGTSDETYTLINGQAMLTESKSDTNGTKAYSYNDVTGAFDILTGTTDTITTYTYVVRGGELKRETVTSDSQTISEQTDGSGVKGWERTIETTTYAYTGGGYITSASGTGYGSSYEDIGNGWASHNITIDVPYDIINGIARVSPGDPNDPTAPKKVVSKTEILDIVTTPYSAPKR